MAEKKSYKVVLESVTQEKKKLLSVVSYSERSPNDYTFVPIGAPELTEYCKEMSRRRGLRIYVVSAAPKSSARYDPSKISHHVHRVGHHFPNNVVETACVQLKMNNPQRGRPGREFQGTLEPTAIARRLDQHGERIGLSTKYEEVDPQRQKQAVSAAIKDLFPKIPADEQEAIVSRAFEEGSDRIGTQKDLPLARRVQLAVVAHIRHTKTDYDHLLKTHSWGEARRMVEHLCLEQIVRWRGEDDEEDLDGELEDIFQEVIVLDDESDEHDGGGDDAKNINIEIHRNRRIVPHSANEPFSNASFERLVDLPQRNGPEIISVKPMRAHRPLALVTQDIYQQRFSDAKARVARSNDHRPLHPPLPSLFSSPFGQQGGRLAPPETTMTAQKTFHPPQSYAPFVSTPSAPDVSRPVGHNTIAEQRHHGMQHQARADPKLLKAPSKPFYVSPSEPLRHPHSVSRLLEPQQWNGHEVYASIEQSPAKKWHDAQQSHYTKHLAPMASIGVGSEEPRYLQPSSAQAWSVNPMMVPSTLQRGTIERSVYEEVGVPVVESRGSAVDLTISPTKGEKRNLRYHPYERSGRPNVARRKSPLNTARAYAFGSVAAPPIHRSRDQPPQLAFHLQGRPDSMEAQGRSRRTPSHPSQYLYQAESYPRSAGVETRPTFGEGLILRDLQELSHGPQPPSRAASSLGGELAATALTAYYDSAQGGQRSQLHYDLQRYTSR